MEPLHPKLRAALKKAYPDLTDEDIDRSEELLAQRMLYDPEKEADRIAELDRERMELIRRVMPQYAEIARILAAEQAAERVAPKPKFTAEIKSPKTVLLPGTGRVSTSRRRRTLRRPSP